MLGKHFVVVAVCGHGLSINLKAFLKILGSDIAESYHFDLGTGVAENGQMRSASTVAGPDHPEFPWARTCGSPQRISLRPSQSRGPRE
jgi:hypothetical protein